MKKNIDINNATLESIIRQKQKTLQEITQQQKVINSLSRHMFTPLSTATNKAHAFMRLFNLGMAAYDGVITGMKLVKRFMTRFS